MSNDIIIKLRLSRNEASLVAGIFEIAAERYAGAGKRGIRQEINLLCRSGHSMADILQQGSERVSACVRAVDIEVNRQAPRWIEF